MGVMPGDAAGLAFLRATGFAFHSTLWDLDLPAGVGVEPPAWPPGVRVRLLDPDRDIRAWAELFNAAFADHATPLQLDLERVEEGWATWPFRAEDLLLAEDGSGALVGFCATEPRRRPDGSAEPRAEIWTIGVRPDAQGRGLGRRLLRWGVHHLRAAGAETVALSVNGRNANALGLYESEGFVRVSTRDRWARPVVAHEPGA
jgi:mycothiol synthase